MLGFSCLPYFPSKVSVEWKVCTESSSSPLHTAWHIKWYQVNSWRNFFLQISIAYWLALVQIFLQETGLYHCLTQERAAPATLLRPPSPYYSQSSGSAPCTHHACLRFVVQGSLPDAWTLSVAHTFCCWALIVLQMNYCVDGSSNCGPSHLGLTSGSSVWHLGDRCQLL